MPYIRRVFNAYSGQTEDVTLSSLLSHFQGGVLIASKHQLMLAALQAMLEAVPTLECGLTATSAQALEALQSRSYDLLICTQSLQSGSGVQLAKQAKALHPKIPILFFLTVRSEAMILKEADLYCDAIIAEWDLDHPESPLLASLRGLLQGDAIYRSPSVRVLLDANSQKISELLTPREKSVLNLILSGLSNQEIANTLVLSPSTAKSYSRDVMRKLGVKNRHQAVLRAIELGLLDPLP